MIMHDGEGGQTREYSGVYPDNTNRETIAQSLLSGLFPGHFPWICQMIILMNYEDLIGTKAGSSEWFSTLSKWSLEEEEEEVLIAGI